MKDFGIISIKYKTTIEAQINQQLLNNGYIPESFDICSLETESSNNMDIVKFKLVHVSETTSENVKFSTITFNYNTILTK